MKRLESPSANVRFADVTRPTPDPEYLPANSAAMKAAKSEQHSVKLASSLFDYYEINYSIGALRTYIDTAIPVLEELDNKIKNYGLQMERPLDILLQVERLKRLSSGIVTVAEKALLFGRSKNPGGMKQDHILNMKFTYEFQLRDFKVDD